MRPLPSSVLPAALWRLRIDRNGLVRARIGARCHIIVGLSGLEDCQLPSQLRPRTLPESKPCFENEV
jgi:hypothetical protein